jgi:hypothetical protein
MLRLPVVPHRFDEGHASCQAEPQGHGKSGRTPSPAKRVSCSVSSNCHNRTTHIDPEVEAQKQKEDDDSVRMHRAPRPPLGPFRPENYPACDSENRRTHQEWSEQARKDRRRPGGPIPCTAQVVESESPAGAPKLQGERWDEREAHKEMDISQIPEESARAVDEGEKDDEDQATHSGEPQVVKSMGIKAPCSRTTLEPAPERLQLSKYRSVLDSPDHRAVRFIGCPILASPDLR